MKTIVATITAATLLLMSAIVADAGAASPADHGPWVGSPLLDSTDRTDAPPPLRNDWFILRPGFYLNTVNIIIPSGGASIQLDLHRDLVGLRLGTGITVVPFDLPFIGPFAMFDLTAFAVVHPLPFGDVKDLYLVGGRHHAFLFGSSRGLLREGGNGGIWLAGAGWRFPIGEESERRFIMPEIRVGPLFHGDPDNESVLLWAGVTWTFGEY